MKFGFQKLDLIIRLLIGLLFVISALLKLKSIDSFEIYIYSFGILKLNFAFLLSRLIISIELLLGLILIIGIYLKKVILFSILMLSVFLVFISYLLLSQNPEDCHCFGEFIEVSHFYSIIKNIIIIIFLIIIYKRGHTEIKYKNLLLMIAFVISISLPLIISPPDSFVYSRYTNNNSFNEGLLKEFIEENHQLSSGKRILCFFGTSCKFCKLAAKKLSVIVNKANNTDVIYYIFCGSEDSVNKFIMETRSLVLQYSILSTDKFLRITNGTMPLIILIEDNEIKGNYGYRNIGENDILNFINN